MMTSRRLLFGALAAMGLVACDKQAAGPAVDLTEANTGAVRMVVLSDQSNTASTNFQARSGVSVRIYAAGDTVPLRQVNTASDGSVLFVGLAAGEYIVRPSVRPLSVFTGGDAATATVAVADTAVTDTLRVRLGGKVSGFLAAEYFDGQKFDRVRFPGITVAFYRETATAGVYEATPFAHDTTDGAGVFDVPVLPGPGRVRMVWNADGIPALSGDDTLTFGGSSTVESSPRGDDNATTTGGVGANANVTRNLVYSYPNAIRGSVFRDANGNGVQDAGEALVSGDDVVLQLRSGDSTFRVLGTSGRITSSTATTYVRSLRPGTYRLTLDMSASRFSASAPRVRQDTVTVTIPSKSGNVTANFPIPPR